MKMDYAMKRWFTYLAALSILFVVQGLLVNKRVKRQGTKECNIGQNETGDCIALAQCFSDHSADADELKKLENFHGCDEGTVCCPRVTSNTDVASETPTPQFFLRRRPYASAPSLGITQIQVAQAKQAAEEEVAHVEELEGELLERNLVVQNDSPEAFHLAIFGDSPQAAELAKDGAVSVKASQEIVKGVLASSQAPTTTTGLPPAVSDVDSNGPGREDGVGFGDIRPISGGIPQESDVVQEAPRRKVPKTFFFRGFENETVIKDNCPPPPACPNMKYRTINGTCNNMANPKWGRAFTEFQRLLPNRYEDRLNMTRNIAKDGTPLPSPRKVSTTVAIDRNNPINWLTNLFQLFGQFLDHDLTQTAVTRGKDGSGILCCRPEILQNPSLRHPACFPIIIPEDDPFYSQFKKTCLEFVRSAPAPRPDCAFGPREQLNQLTSYIDGSQIYGSTEDQTMSLRSFEGGKLKVTMIHEGQHLPKQTGSGGCLISKRSENDDRKCFKAGDSRANEHGLLTVMHTVWLREHNRIAEELAQLNTKWTDETLFQETRRIVGAELQHIVYNEFLPLLLGSEIMESFSLQPLFSDFFTEYDPNLNAGAINAFATAAFRYGHSMVQVLNNSKIWRHNNRKSNAQCALRKIMSLISVRRKSGASSDETVEIIGEALARSLSKSIRRASQELNPLDLVPIRAYASSGTVELSEPDGESVFAKIPLKLQFFNPELLYDSGNLDRAIRGFTSQQSQTADSFFTDQLTNHLFEIPGTSFGLDLVSLNIQRGRDHGLPPYNEWREACGLQRIKDFEDLANVMSNTTAESLSKCYKDVDDIDLYIGGISEFPVEGGAVGPTFACIIAEQFRRYKFGDRFWYENGAMDTSFTKAQLNQIRKVNLARVLCDNSDGLNKIQPLVFVPPAKFNEMVFCNSTQIPSMTLTHWKDTSESGEHGIFTVFPVRQGPS